MAYHRQQGVDTAIVRIFNTYGPRMRPHDGRAIPTFVRQAMERKPITVFGDGSQTRSFCYVDDLIRGLIALQESGEHLPVNIGNPNEFTLLELAEKVLEVWGGGSEIVFEALPVDDPKIRQPDITRASQILGWEPEVSLDEGLRRLHAALAGSARCVAASRLRRGRARRGRCCSPCPRRPRRATSSAGIFDDAQIHYGDPDKVFPIAEDAEDAADPRQPRLGRRERRRQAASGESREPERPAYDWSVVRPHRQLRGPVRDQGRLLDHRHAAVGERRRRRQRRAAEPARPAAVRGRGRDALRRQLRGCPTGGCFRPCASGSPGTSRTTRPSCGRSTGRSAAATSPQSPIDYAKICNAIYRGVSITTVGASKVACGVTGPRGNNQPNSARPALAPLAFLRGMKKAGATKFDAYAHHPYYGAPERDALHAAAAREARQRADRGHAREHQRPDQGSDAPLRQQADLGHRVRLPDEPARPDLRRLAREPGALSDPGLRDHEEEPAHRHDALVPAAGRAPRAPARKAGSRG